MEVIVDINISRIIEEAIQELNHTLTNKISLQKGENIRLYGNGGALDSLSLVNLIVTIEGAIEEQTGVGLILANDKALSQKNSPFATIGKLKTYVEKLYKDEVLHAF